MLHSLKERYGERLSATDSDIGHVRDFYFDDKSWAIRYLVADTGGWLRGRLVLISPLAFGHLYPEGKVFLVNLTQSQIESSPSIDEHKPLSRQQEEEYHRHYGQLYYAEAMPMWGMAGFPVLIPPPSTEDASPVIGDAHLRSARSIESYRVEASDGRVGAVSDFLVDARTWVIQQVIVESGHWYAGKRVAVDTEKVSRISYPESTVYVDSPRDAFTGSTDMIPARDY